MRIEVICTGDELLTGLTADTNSPFFMGKLFALGEQVRGSTVVGDVREEIVRVFHEVARRAEVILVSGGLGPTTDDLTAECAAKAANVPLAEDAQVLASLQDRFAKRGILFSPNNARQALVPQGAEVVHNPKGSAPMFIMTLGKCLMFFVPGVPREYRYLVESVVIPRIAQMLEKDPARTFRANRLLKIVGMAESHLDAKVAEFSAEHPAVTFGYRTHFPENHLKLVAEGRTQAEADQALAQAEQKSREMLGDRCFGADGDGFSEIIGRMLSSKGHTLAVAESCTGGELAEAISQPAGASAYFLGSAVCYANDMKERWVDVEHALLVKHGAVSEETARRMAEGTRAKANAAWGLAVTGIAGPGGGSEEKPVGTVFCALSSASGTEARKFHFQFGDRTMIRQASVYAALNMLRLALMGAVKP